MRRSDGTRARWRGRHRELALRMSRLRAFLDASPVSQVALALMREATGRPEPLAAIARIVPLEDEEISRELAASFKRQGIAVYVEPIARARAGRAS